MKNNKMVEKENISGLFNDETALEINLTKNIIKIYDNLEKIVKLKENNLNKESFLTLKKEYEKAKNLKNDSVDKLFDKYIEYQEKNSISSIISNGNKIITGANIFTGFATVYSILTNKLPLDKTLSVLFGLTTFTTAKIVDKKNYYDNKCNIYETFIKQDDVIGKEYKQYCKKKYLIKKNDNL